MIVLCCIKVEELLAIGSRRICRIHLSIRVGTLTPLLAGSGRLGRELLPWKVFCQTVLSQVPASIVSIVRLLARDLKYGVELDPRRGILVAPGAVMLGEPLRGFGRPRARLLDSHRRHPT